MANAREVAECLMLSIAFLGALSSLNRADCNFPLFVYLWWAFFHVPEDKKVKAHSPHYNSLAAELGFHLTHLLRSICMTMFASLPRDTELRVLGSSPQKLVHGRLLPG